MAHTNLSLPRFPTEEEKAKLEADKAAALAKIQSKPRHPMAKAPPRTGPKPRGKSL